MNFFQRVIVIPEKLTALAAAGLLWVFVKFLVWLSAVTGLDLTSLPVEGIAVGLAVLLAMGVKVFLEKSVPEKWHIYINSFLAWLASVVIADLLFKFYLLG